LLMEM